MPLFSRHKRTPEEWFQHLRRSENPLVLTKPLLSGQPFTDKVKILLAMPDSAYKERVWMRELESTLENAGYIELAQVVRWRVFLNRDGDRGVFLRWSQNLIEADIEARWIVQREICVGEEVRALEKTMSLCPDGQKTTELSHQLNTYQEELQDLGKRYWIHSRSYWKLEGGMPGGVFIRGFRACREDPDWYLSAWLRQDCAGRGGCCGRSCGCCEKPRETKRGWSRGHCTSACGCCVRSSPNITGGTQNDIADFPFDVVSYNTSYSHRVFRAYIWGLTFIDDMGLIGYYL